MIERILKETRVVAMVGASSNPERASNTVMSYLKNAGYRVIPVNPSAREVLGEKTYPDLASIPERVDVVDVFRAASDVPPIAEEAIKIKARVLWMQLGIVNEEAASAARKAGLDVVMDHCMKKEHERLTREGKLGK